MGKNKQEMTRPETNHKPFWKWGLCFFCIALLLINIVLILIALPSSGWDFRVYISAVIAVLQQLNPYDPGVISQFSMLPNFPFAYPPYTLAFFYLFYLTDFFYIYSLVWTASLLASFYVINRLSKTNRLYLFTLLVTGFFSLFWTYLTGNLGAIYLFLVSLIFYFLSLKREYLSSIFLGIVASFNLFPLAFSAIYLLLRKSLIERGKIIAISLLTVGVLFLLSFLVNPVLFGQYMEGMQSGSSNPYFEGAGGNVPVSFYINTPTSYWLINQTLKFFGLHDSIVFFTLCIGYVLLIGGIWYLFYRDNRDNEILLMCFAMFALFLILPRLKPYYFTLILIPLYLLTKEYGMKRKIVILSFASLVPLLLYFSYQVTQNILTSFGQLWASLAVFIVVFHYSRKDSSIRNQAG